MEGKKRSPMKKVHFYLASTFLTPQPSSQHVHLPSIFFFTFCLFQSNKKNLSNFSPFFATLKGKKGTRWQGKRYIYTGEDRLCALASIPVSIRISWTHTTYPRKNIEVLGGFWKGKTKAGWSLPVTSCAFLFPFSLHFGGAHK